MPKQKVREDINDMLRRGIGSLDPVIALMRRGPTALDELALAADRPSVKAELLAVVKRQPQRFAAVIGTLTRGVRQHSLTIELLAAAGGDAIARAALAAWDEGRREEAAYLADAAAAIGPETAESMIAAARVAADGDFARACNLYRQALDRPLGDDLVAEAAGALFDAGETETALRALVARGDSQRTGLAGLAALACLRGEIGTVLSVVGAAAGGDPQFLALLKQEVSREAREECTALKACVAQLSADCRRLLSESADMLLADNLAEAGQRLEASIGGALRSAADLMTVVHLRSMVSHKDNCCATVGWPALLAVAADFARERLGINIDSDAPAQPPAAMPAHLAEAAAWLVWSHGPARRNRYPVRIADDSLHIAAASVGGEQQRHLRDYVFKAARAILVLSGCRVVPGIGESVVSVATSANSDCPDPGIDLTQVLNAGGIGSLAPVSAALATLAAELTEALDAAAAVAGGNGAGNGHRNPQPALAKRIGAAAAICDQLDEYIGLAMRPATLLAQLPGPLLAVAADRIRAALGEDSLSLRPVSTAPVIRVDGELMMGALLALARDLAPKAQDSPLLLRLVHETGAGHVTIELSAAVAAQFDQDSLALSLGRRIADANGGRLTTAAEPSRLSVGIWLPAEEAAASPVDLADLAPDAAMALRAATGMIAAGDVDTVCFLIDKAVCSESAFRLKPHLARHLLLPRAAWALSSQAVRGGLPVKTYALPARRLEELCRAVVDDRLQRRLSDVRSYAHCLAAFMTPLKGWPPPASVPGLSDADLTNLVDGLWALADTLEREAATEALTHGQQVLRILLRVRPA